MEDPRPLVTASSAIMSFRKDFRIIFLGEKIGFKWNYIKW
jgi:hypothetical protein